jgi:hypothetical protein
MTPISLRCALPPAAYWFVFAISAVCSLVGAGARAASDVAPTYAAVSARIAAEQIERDPGWLALLHYHHPLGGAGWKSHADASPFFLASAGNTDPRAELLADLQALFFNAVDTSARCRFPARYEWLRERLALPADGTALEACAALQDWYQPLAANTVSIDFASSYLENPSSLFGHTFLRFGTPGTPLLLTPTVNYAADSSRENGKLAFIVKGLLGGFPGVADQLPYFRRLRSYSDNEGRAIWEYPLALDTAQIRRLLLHLWEIKDSVFDYYFIDENCSYRTLALIAVARPDLDLLRAYNAEVVPVETIRTLRASGLINATVYRPSAPRELSWHTRGFSTAMLRAVAAIARGQQQPDDLSRWRPEQRTQILSAAAEYFAILVNRDQIPITTREQVMPALLRERLQHETPPAAAAPPTPPAPDTGHSGRAASVGFSDRQGRLGAEVGYDGFRHTLIDRLAGYDPGAEITVLGTRLRWEEGNSGTLERLDLLRVQSQAPSSILFQQSAWSLHFGAERKYVNAERALLGSFGYASGRAVNVGVGVLGLTLGANLDGGPALRGDTGFEGAVRVELTRQRDGLSAQAFVEYAKYLLGESSARHRYGLRFGLPLTRQLAITADLERAGARQDENQVVIELRHAFGP